MRKILTIVAAIALTASAIAQSPEKMSYQAVIRNSSDQLVANQPVGMQISIIQGSATGSVVYAETQTPTSNANGLISIEIGGGTVVSGTFSSIDWTNGPYFIKTETDPTGGTGYTITGTTQLLSVPYALYAKNAGNGFSGDFNDLINIPDLSQYLTTEIDSSTTNELQVLSISNDTIFLSDGGFVKLPAGTSFSGSFNDLTDIPTGLSDGDDDTQLTETEVDAYVANNGYLTEEADGDATNELQVLSISNDTIFLSDGGFVKLPAGTSFSGSFNDLTDVPANLDTDTTDDFDGDFAHLTNVPAGLSDGDDNTQLTEAEVDAYVTDNGYLTTEVDGSTTNELQVITISNDTIFLSDGGLVKLPASVSFSGSFNDLDNIPTTLAGYGITDAMNTSHAANGITLTNTSNWNTAYGWGDHVSAGYLTSYTETDPAWTTASTSYYTKTNMQTSGSAQLHFGNLTNTPTTISGYGITDAMSTSHAANGITSTNISNWNMSYGWGDHANAGYLTSYTETDPEWTTASANYYTKTNMQTSGNAQLHFDNLSSRPTTLSGYGITDAMSTSHAANGITSTNISNWNTAYGWGDHAIVGYLTAEVDGSVTNEIELPTQTGNSGKYLTTDGSSPSWATITKSTLGLGNVENTALSTWTGSTSITTLGTISSGTWQGSSISATYIGNLPASQITSGTIDNARINWAAPNAIGSTTAAAGSFTSLSASSGLTVSAGTITLKPAGSGGTSGQFLTTDGNGVATWSSISKSTVGLGNVENTALSTWTGSTSITTLGTISSGTWQGSSISATYIGNLPASQITSGTIDNARINWAAPNAIGSTTAAAGSFTSLSANNGLNVSAGTVTIKPAGSGGTNGQVLTTNGSGVATWQSVPGASLSVTTQNVNYSIATTDGFIITSGNCTFTLPLASSAGAGKIIYLYSTVSAISLTPSGSDTFWDADGLSHTSTSTPVASIYNGTFISDGVSAWYQVAK
ncbi:MAG: hypothetical protein A2437_00580 [Bacteroidetes bacterium RIFOXYC2_FULL_40_12]|nr:MAG: hypothetical protein A2437_00580 [Bacteroidetes bacterium RIFOXYC2_FULL_40_12]